MHEMSIAKSSCTPLRLKTYRKVIRVGALAELILMRFVSLQSW
jgi:hypothetical protein